jgi:hypothetical protein
MVRSPDMTRLLDEREAAVFMGFKSKNAYRTIRRWCKGKKLLFLERPDGRYRFTEELLIESMKVRPR